MLEEEAEIGIIALENGLVSQEKLNECLTALSEDGGRSLPEMFRDRGLLTAEQIDALRKEALQRIKSRQGGTPVAEALPAAEFSRETTGVEAAVSTAIPAEAARAAQEPRNIFGKFFRVHEIVQGGLGTVFKAYDSKEKWWVALRILGSSHTNPVFVLVGGKPIRASRRSAEWCLKGVDQCWSQKQRFIASGEMDDARAAYEHARQTYRRLITETDVE